MTEWDEKYRDLNNQKKIAGLLWGIGSLLTLGGVLFSFVLWKSFSDPESQQSFDWQSLIIAVVLLPIGILLWNKGRVMSLKRKEENFLVFWKAYKMLEKFHDRKTNEDMKNAIKSVKNIRNLFSGWFRDAAPKSISSMTDPIHNNLREKIIPLIKEKDYPVISSIATGFMNVALQFEHNEIDEEFLKQFKNRLDGFPEPTTKEKIELKKTHRVQDYPIFRVVWIGLVTSIILYIILTSYLAMERGPALIGSILVGVGLTAMIIQGLKKK